MQGMPETFGNYEGQSLVAVGYAWICPRCMFAYIDGNRTHCPRCGVEKIMGDEKKQIANCQTPKMSYQAAHTDARVRMKKGERQVYCTVCQRWKWQHELCEIAETQPWTKKTKK